MESTSVLPYRTDAVALAEWLTARARGRSSGQLRSAVGSPKGVEGTAAAAAALGFTDAAEGVLTPIGERYALADARERQDLLRDVLYRYAPYQEVMAALGDRGGPAETEVRWIEAWWATRGYGSSESNRREGAAAFGRLADHAGLGEYVAGRRGRPTRIRWKEAAFDRRQSPAVQPRGRARVVHADTPDLFSAAPPPPAAPSGPPRRPARDEPATAARAADPEKAPGRPRGDSQVNRITVPLTGDFAARIEVPLRLPAAEKRRLLDLLELLISEE